MKIRNLLSMVIVGATLASCSSTNVNLANEGVLVVGMECAYAPFNWTESTQSDSNYAISNLPGSYVQGYDVQVAKLLADELNLTLEIKAVDWTGLVPSLQSSQIDLIIAGMSPTADRKETIDFTDGYYRSTHVLLVETDSVYASATSLDDFAGANIIGQTGTIYAQLVSQVVEHGAIAGTNLDTVPEIVNAIVNGNVDATILEEPVAMGIVSQYQGQLTYVKIENAFEVSEEDVLVSIGVRKGFVLTDEINGFLTNVLTEEKRNELMTQAIATAPSAE